MLFTWQQQQATSRQIADQLTVTRQGQVGERFSRAVSQLGNSSIDVRLGGLYELEQLARQAPERRLTIMEVVAAYVRQRARPPANLPRLERYHPSQDVAAALAIIGRRSIQANDRHVDLSRVTFGRVILFGVHLNAVDLSGADLRHALLSDAHLSDAELSFVLLSGANLRYADLGSADLGSADLRGVNLYRAYLGHADVVRGDLRGADLRHAELRGADLQLADLRRADLRYADLRGAHLSEAELSFAFLGDADLRGADLGDANLRRARANRFTQWPDGFDWHGAGVELMK